MAIVDPDNINKKMQFALVSARKAAKLTQMDVAERLHKPQSFVSKYETGERKLTIGDYIAVCEALKIKPQKLIERVA